MKNACAGAFFEVVKDFRIKSRLAQLFGEDINDKPSGVTKKFPTELKAMIIAFKREIPCRAFYDQCGSRASAQLPATWVSR